MRFTHALALWSMVPLVLACGSSESGGTPAGDAGVGGGGNGGSGGTSAGANAIGKGDGSPGSVSFVVVYEPPAQRDATDLAFHPTRDELWVLMRELYAGEPCTQTDDSGCEELEGSVVIVSGAGGPNPEYVRKEDPNSWHFMRRPTGIAFGANDTFATIHEARTGNFENLASDYIGPTLWSSDPAIFTIQPPGKNGSHLDMLHSTPFGMGIAHEQGNVYWTFNGDIGALDRYDFKQPHEVGGDDHSDGELYRYVVGELKRLPEVPSHLEYDAATGILYVADTGNQRVVKLDTNSGTPSGEEVQVPDPMATHVFMSSSPLVDVVAPGVLQAPSGLALHEGVLYVTDNATSKIHAFDLDGNSIRTLDTGFPLGSLAGFTIGPDGKAYIADLATSRAYRIDT
jgi:DNA-binding beta-propeller fold protein YncE